MTTATATATEIHKPSGKNTNCIQNMICPGCGNEDTFQIEVTKTFWADVSDEGTGDEGGADTEWDANSNILCPECMRTGTVGEFTYREPPTIYDDIEETLRAARSVPFVETVQPAKDEVFDRVKQWVKDQKAAQAKAKAAANLEKDRGGSAEAAWQDYELPSYLMVTDSSGWEHILGDTEWTRKFWYDDEGVGKGPATFVVRFKKDSEEVEEAYINWE
jgi:hypothetical protein